jgi:hypothetical protein
MKSKSKSNQIKLKIPIIANNESEEEGPKLVRPTPRNLKEIKEISNKPKKIIILKHKKIKHIPRKVPTQIPSKKYS